MSYKLVLLSTLLLVRAGLAEDGGSTSAAPGLPETPTPPQPITAPSRPVQLEPVLILGTRSQTSYATDEPTAASRLPLAGIDMPRSVQVVPAAVIADQQAITPNEIVGNVSSVRPSGSWWGNDEVFIIRGFQQQNLYKDGLRGVAIAGFLDQPAANDVSELDRVEVIKGPGSFLFGRAEPGGIVHYVTKRPRFEPAYSLTQRFASYDSYRTEIDLTGPVTDSAAMRLIGSYQTNNEFVRFADEERGFGSVGATWLPVDRTQVRLRISFLYDDSTYAAGLPIVDGRLLPGVRYDQYLGEPDVNRRISRALETYVEAVHHLSETIDLSLRGGFQPTWVINRDVEPGEYIAPNLILYWNPGTQTLARTLYDSSFDTDNSEVQLGANAAYAPRNWGLDWLADVEGRLSVTAGWERSAGDGPALYGATSRINPFDPVYTGYRLSRTVRAQQELSGTTQETSLTVENHLSWRDTVQLLGGGRLSYVDSRADFDVEPAVFSLHGSIYRTPLTPFVGLLLRPLAALSLYTSYSESYLPPRFPRPTASGRQLEPESGKQIELGTHWEAAEGRLLATASIYQIDKDDLIATDPNDPLFPANIGSARSRGLELDVAGSPWPGWQLIGSYAYTDARITDSEDGTDGNRLFAVPYNSGSVWATYQVQDGLLRGLGAGAGVWFSDAVENDNLNTAKLPSWTQLGAAVSYSRGPVDVRFNLKNLTSEEVFLAQNNVFRAMPAPPRTAVGSVTVRY